MSSQLLTSIPEVDLGVEYGRSQSRMRMCQADDSLCLVSFSSLSLLFSFASLYHFVSFPFTCFFHFHFFVSSFSITLFLSPPSLSLSVRSRMATVEQTEKAKAALAAVMATRRAAGGRGGRGSDDATYARARFHLPREMRDNVGLATDAKALEHFHKKIKR